MNIANIWDSPFMTENVDKHRCSAYARNEAFTQELKLFLAETQSTEQTAET